MKRFIVILLLSLSMAVPVARAGHNDDQDKIKGAVERGDAASYAEVVRVIGQQLNGRIIRVELDREWLQWQYQLRLLEDDGRIIKVKLNAKTLQIIRLEGQKLETVVKVQ